MTWTRTSCDLVNVNVDERASPYRKAHVIAHAKSP